MKCFNPFFRTFPNADYALPMPCGKCLACRYNNAKTWSLRIKLEAMQYDPSQIQFVTLTYDREHLPWHNNLEPAHLQSFIKRLRKVSGLKIRYFACGEYGTERGRPHYHLILFGVTNEQISRFVGISKFDYLRGVRPKRVAGGYDVCWTYGFVEVETAKSQGGLASYVSHYVTSKVDNKHNRAVPEFHRNSMGFGLFIVDKLQFYTPIIKIGEFTHYLGRYLRNKVAEKFGVLDSVIAQSIAGLNDFMVDVISSFKDNRGYYKALKSPPYTSQLSRFALEKYSYLEYNAPAKELLIAQHKLKISTRKDI